MPRKKKPKVAAVQRARRLRAHRQGLRGCLLPCGLSVQRGRAELGRDLLLAHNRFVELLVLFLGHDPDARGYQRLGVAANYLTDELKARLAAEFGDEIVTPAAPVDQEEN